VDPAVGVELCCRVGDRVERGQPLANLLHNDREVEKSRALLEGAFSISDQATTIGSRILEVLR
jgi:thymidine phosphorylase